MLSGRRSRNYIFRMTGRKHIFITGSRGSGKSHLVNNMLKHMSDSFNLLQSHRTDTPQVVIKSNLVADNKEFVIGVPGHLELILHLKAII